MKTRQPLARALISAPGWDEVPDDLRAQVSEELNVVELATLAQAQALIDLSVKPNFRALGQRHGPVTKQIAAAIAVLDPAALVAAVRAGTASVQVAGNAIGLQPEDLIITETPRTGWAVASEGSETVALDLELTQELRQLGVLRDVIRVVQEARKNAGFDVTDRIKLHWQAGPETASVIEAYGDVLAAEVLATEIGRGQPTTPGAFHQVTEPDLDLQLWLAR